MSAAVTRGVGAAALVLAVLLVYAGALSAPFQFDDYAVIVDNPDVHGLAAWWQSMPGIRPLLKLSYALNWQLSPEARGFRLFNVAVHASNALLVWALALHWLRALAPRLPQPARAAWWIALLFALHPATTEAVTYVSGRSVSLMALAGLASLWVHAEVEARGLRGGWQALSPLLFALALGVRETAVTVPLALLALAWFRGTTLRDALPALRWHGVVLAAVVLAALLLPGYPRFFAYSVGTRGLDEQLLGQTVAHAHLFLHSLLGLGTNVDPDLRVPAGWNLVSTSRLLVVMAAIALALASRRRWPWLGFGIAWYLLQLAPSNSLMPRFDLANDRHLYFALPGATMVFVAALQQLKARFAGTVLLLVAAGLLAQASHRRNLDYRSELSLWQATVRASPAKPRPWTNLGYARQIAGDDAGAAAAYRCALQHDPDHRQAQWNLAALGPDRIQPRPDDCDPPPSPP